LPLWICRGHFASQQASTPPLILDGCEPAVSAGRLQPANIYWDVLSWRYPVRGKEWKSLRFPSKTTAAEHWSDSPARMAEGVHEALTMLAPSNHSAVHPNTQAFPVLTSIHIDRICRLGHGPLHGRNDHDCRPAMLGAQASQSTRRVSGISRDAMLTLVARNAELSEIPNRSANHGQSEYEFNFGGDTL